MSQTATALTAVLASTLAGAGAWLIWTAAWAGAGAGAGPGVRRRGAGRPAVRITGRPTSSSGGWWAESLGLGDVRAAELAAAVAVVAAAGGLAAYLLFGAAAPSVLSAIFAGTFPVAGYRRRRQMRAEEAAAGWPRLLEEIRLRAGSLGRSVPQALFEAGRSAPAEWRPAFDAAEREWLLTVDFARTLHVLRDSLVDPTADVICETLLTAHEVGGTDLDPHLAQLIEDRTQDLQSRRDAASRLAGVRFARRFVLLVPLGMALAGLTIGSGRQAYTTAGGQVAVIIGLLAIAACWWWAGRLMRIPQARRVFR